MYNEDDSIYCKSIVGKSLEILFGIVLWVAMSPFMALYAIGTYARLLCVKAERLDYYISRKLAEFFG